jgi:hypothetical protein
VVDADRAEARRFRYGKVAADEASPPHSKRFSWVSLHAGSDDGTYGEADA